MEFPTLNQSRVGRAGRYLYTVGDDGILKYGLQTSAAREHRLEAGTAAGEAVFVPAAGGHAEDDGWLLSIVGDRAGTRSELLVLDAGDLAVQASVRLPRRVPTGFHGGRADPRRGRGPGISGAAWSRASTFGCATRL